MLKKIWTAIQAWAHALIYSEEFKEKVVQRPKKDFTRGRKMDFADYILYLTSGRKESLQAGLNAYRSQKEFYSKQAFSKGRQRIKPEAFQILFEGAAQKFYEMTSGDVLHEYHLLGIDGTRLNLPCTPVLQKIYDQQESNGAPQVQALASCIYDLLNGIILDATITSCKGNEREEAKTMIGRFDTQFVKNPLFIMDRGYPSADLLAFIEGKGYHYVMRCCTEFIKSMTLSGKDCTVVHQFTKYPEPLKLRVIKLPISENVSEFLITNLFDQSLSVEDFGEIYRKRWGIETRYNDIKNKLEIENFTGITPEAILQDFYATLFLANLAGTVEYDFREEIEAAHSSAENKYKYRMNVNMEISVLKGSVVEMLSTESDKKRGMLLDDIEAKLERCVVPIRPGRSTPRKKRHASSKYSQNTKYR
jgi:hypothetical protein